jgi:hypothetical protein
LMTDELDYVLQKAINAINMGDKTTGQRLLSQVIRANPQNEVAWMWLGWAVAEVDRKLDCYCQVLRINPDNSVAQRWIEELREKPTHTTRLEASHQGTQDPLRSNMTFNVDRGYPVRRMASAQEAASRRALLWVILAIVLIICVVLSQHPESTSNQRSSDDTSWVRGGTLHSATVREWRQAPYANRLATTADFIVTTEDVDLSDTSKFKRMATEVESCISQTVSGGDMDNEDASLVYAMCVVLMYPQ